MRYPKRLFLYSALLVCISTTHAAQTTLSLQEAINQAQSNDPWLASKQHQQNALLARSAAVNRLPNPKLSLSVANLASDTFDFNQEAMSQFKVGLSQNFPRGKTLQLKRQQLALQSKQYPHQYRERQAHIALKVSLLWLDAYKAKQSIALIEKNRVLFEQLPAIAASSYSNALGSTGQQDIIRAQLSLTLLEDRLLQLQQQYDKQCYQLEQWLHNETNGGAIQLKLSEEAPIVSLQNPLLENTSNHELIRYLQNHPATTLFDEKIRTSQTAIQMAQQKHKAQWGLNASYGYRDEDLQGNDRADLFSLGVSVDLPFFSRKKQDKDVQAANFTTEAIKSDKTLLLRKMLARYKVQQAQLARLNKRLALYQNTLLPQMHQQAEAALSAYTNDTGDFSAVVNARIDELNAKIDSLNIHTEKSKAISQLNYFTIAATPIALTPTAITPLQQNKLGTHHE